MLSLDRRKNWGFSFQNYAKTLLHQDWKRIYYLLLSVYVYGNNWLNFFVKNCIFYFCIILHQKKKIKSFREATDKRLTCVSLKTHQKIFTCNTGRAPAFSSLKHFLRALNNPQPSKKGVTLSTLRNFA